MPEVSQAQIDQIASTLDRILQFVQAGHQMHIDVKKQLADLQSHHDQMAFALRRKGPINRK